MPSVHAARPSSSARSGGIPLARCLALALFCSVAFVGCDGAGESGNTSELQPLPTFLRWNQIATDASAADHGAAREQFGPCRSSRALAIVHVAMFETLLTANGGFSSYLNVPHPGGSLSQSVAIAKAAGVLRQRQKTYKDVTATKERLQTLFAGERGAPGNRLL